MPYSTGFPLHIRIVECEQGFQFDHTQLGSEINTWNDVVVFSPEASWHSFLKSLLPIIEYHKRIFTNSGIQYISWPSCAPAISALRAPGAVSGQLRFKQSKYEDEWTIVDEHNFEAAKMSIRLHRADAVTEVWFQISKDSPAMQSSDRPTDFRSQSAFSTEGQSSPLSVARKADEDDHPPEYASAFTGLSETRSNSWWRKVIGLRPSKDVGGSTYAGC